MAINKCLSNNNFPKSENESDRRLATEMGLLSESMQGLRDAIKRQEHQLSKYVNKQGFQEAQLFPKGEFSEEYQKFYQTQSNDFEQHQFGTRLCSAESNISQSSHWSCSLDTINSSIGDLKVVLKSQDKQVIRLITENEELKNEVKKIEKELKKTKFLLKAERETFEQYKKDTFQEVKKQKSEESCETRPNKHIREMIKLKSELAHYRQMFVEQSHTVNRLSKLVTNLKGDRILLKDKLLQQEKKANKFILEMAQRFDNSRKEFNFVISKKLEEQRVSPGKLAVYKLADRNARLAYDNSMLKLELDMLKKQLLERRIEENKLQCFTGRSVQYSKETNNFDFENPHLEKCGNSNTFNTLKASVSEKSGLTNVSFQNCTIAVKTSVTSLINRNKKSVLMWQPDLNPRSDSKVSNSNQVNSSAVSSEDVRLMRVFSAPQLTASHGSLAIKELQDLKTK